MNHTITQTAACVRSAIGVPSDASQNACATGIASVTAPAAEAAVQVSSKAVSTSYVEERMAAFELARQSPDCCFIGIDLHQNNAYVSVCVNGKDNRPKTIYSARTSTMDGGKALQDVLSSYCDGRPHIATVESTYNIYFLSDIFEAMGWNLVIADPSTVSESKTKNSNDATDAAYLAERLRTNSLRFTLLQPKAPRALRDLIRLRMELVQDRARYKIIFTNMLTNQRSIKRDCDWGDLVASVVSDGADSTKLRAYFGNLCIRTKAASIIRMIANLDAEIKSVESVIYNNIKGIKYLDRLKSACGCGDVLAAVISSEIGDIDRFPGVKNFVSYCRLAPTSKLSNGKSKGMGNAKNGNAYLSWAFTELANFMVRFDPNARKLFDRLLKKYGQLRVKAIRALAARIARGMYHVLKKNGPFDSAKCFFGVPVGHKSR